MTYDEKKSLYESIMKDIAKTVKRQINENSVSEIDTNERKIIREEVIKEVVKYLDSKLYDWVQVSHSNRVKYPDTIMKKEFIYDLKQALKE
jgi:hypothetical protein